MEKKMWEGWISLTLMWKLPIADLFPGGSAARSNAADEVLYGGSKTRSCMSAEGKKMDEFQDGIQETTAEHLCGAEKFWPSETHTVEKRQRSGQEAFFFTLDFFHH